MFFRNCSIQSFGNMAEIPPAEWCATTLHSLSDKYEHLSESRKVKPPFAEAVLNSFKSKLLTLVSEQSLYESDDNSEGDADWPLVGDYSQYMDLKPGSDALESSYISAAVDAAGCSSENQEDDEASIPLTTSASKAAGASADDDDNNEDGEDELGLLSPSPSPTSMVDPSYLDVDTSDVCSAQGDNDDAVINIPVGIDEALRRILSSASSQLLSMNFSTFAIPDTVASASDAEGNGLQRTSSSQELLVNADDVEADDDAEDTEDDDEAGQSLADSGGCSPSSLDSPEEPIEYAPSSDAVGVFVNSFDFVGNGSWEAVQPPSCSPDTATATATPAAADSVTAASKRKRCPADLGSDEAEADAAVSESLCARSVLSVSPCKRSRSSACSAAAAAAAAAVPSTNTAAPVPVAAPKESSAAA
ncbi:hypothetical protein GQ54DRAFT_312501 [Martensiomyces pterosporus]|nr:hypothetical protein GQ54DRAFT_312501 [Martensiomyces pterosporus]